MSNVLFPLLQLSDSNFPSGAFSHSFGLETYIQEHTIKDKKSLAESLTIYLQKQLIFTDGLACRLTYEALERNAIAELAELDQLLFSSSIAQETRAGNRRIGERMAKICVELFPSTILIDYLKGIKQKYIYGHSSIVFAIVAFHLQASKESTISTYLFTVISSLIQNAVRGIPLGQTDGQKILVELQPLIEKAVGRILQLSKEDLGAACPGLEIAQMRHERLDVRLFMS